MQRGKGARPQAQLVSPQSHLSPLGGPRERPMHLPTIKEMTPGANSRRACTPGSRFNPDTCPCPHFPIAPRKGEGALNTSSDQWPAEEEGCPQRESWGAAKLARG